MSKGRTLLFKIIFFNLLAYLIGSISSAIIVCRLKNLPDPLTQGSKNPGATNVLRIGGKSPAIWVVLGDILKGFLPIMIAKAFDIEGFALATIAISAVLGHMFPLFFKFKGGKGIATAFGALLALSWVLGIFVALSWGIIAFLFHYSSLASIVATLLVPIYSYFLAPHSYIPAILFLSGLILFRHRENMKRLLKGTEPSFLREKL